HAVELVLPFAILFGWRGRAAAAVGFVVLLVLLAATGNYGYFQLLSIVLSLTLVDDRVWAKLGVPIPDAEPSAQPWLLAPLGAVLLTVAVAQGLVSAGNRWRPVIEIAQAGDEWRSVNRYGLFATMTRSRPEITLEVTEDGATWAEWPLVWKPGDPGRVPPQSAPHLPRLEWQLWFAALGSCHGNRWVQRLEALVRSREPSVIRLLGTDPLDGRRIRDARAIRWEYRPATDGGTWERTRIGPYCPRPG
nr:lipase maturation factor family protein [Deltaproteobacteria bacterium]